VQSRFTASHLDPTSEETDAMNTMIRTVVGLGLVALIAGPAAAQGQGRGGFGRGMGGGGLAGLLGNASVQKEIKLDDAQIEKAKGLAQKINDEMREKRQGLQDLEPQERMAKMQELNREANTMVEKSAGEFLKPEQITRLHQISYQQRGLQAFSDPEVAKKLNLTDAQKADIKTISDDSMQEMRSIMQGFQDDREGTTKKLAEFRKETLTKATAKLNDEQQKSWKELLGTPFEVQYPPRNN
jgi:DNA uptake protein ComE-like DNA-binding protein